MRSQLGVRRGGWPLGEGRIEAAGLPQFLLPRSRNNLGQLRGFHWSQGQPSHRLTIAWG